MWTRLDSNQGPSQCECDALPLSHASLLLNLIFYHPRRLRNNIDASTLLSINGELVEPIDRPFHKRVKLNVMIHIITQIWIRKFL